MPIISSIVAAATAVTASITTAFGAGGILAAGTIAGTLARAALTLGLSVGLSALTSKGSKSKNQTAASVTNVSLKIGGDIAREVAFGRIATKGQLINAWVHGAGNSSLTQIIALSDGWCGPITGVWDGDKLLTIRSLSATHGETMRFDTTEKAQPYLNVRYWDGRPGQAGVASYLSSQGITDLASTDRGAGTAFLVITLVNVNSFWSGNPDLIFEFDGYRCYDIRKDSTAGGSGSHRWNDPATWEPSNNPAIHVYNYLRGIRSEGQTFMGMEVPEFDLMSDTFISAANVCDEVVSITGGGTEPRYRAAAVIAADDGEHRSSLAPLIQAMGGSLIERTGQFGVIAGAAQGIAATITDDDIVWAEGVRWALSSSRAERFNEIHGQYLDPASRYQANSYARLIDTAALALDSERLAAQLDFKAAPSSTQAQRIAWQKLNLSRKEATAEITLGMRHLALEIGDWIRWTSTRGNFNRVFVITNWGLTPAETLKLDLREIGSDVFGTTSVVTTPVPSPDPMQSPGAGVSTISGFTVQEVVAPGSGRPVAQCTWTPPNDERIQEVIIEYRPVGSILATRVVDPTPEDGSFVIDQPATGATYEYRATIRTFPARPTTWTGWVSLAPIPRDDLSAEVSALVAGVHDRINAMRALANTASADALDQIARNRLDLIDLSSEVGDASATARQTATSFASLEGSFAELRTDIEAAFGGDTATATDFLDALATGDLVAARAIRGTSASASQIFTDGRFDITSAVDSSIGGGGALGGTRIGFSAKASTAGATAVSAFFIEAWVTSLGASKSRAVLDCQQFLLRDGSRNYEVPITLIQKTGAPPGDVAVYIPDLEVDTINIRVDSVTERFVQTATNTVSVSPPAPGTVTTTLLSQSVTGARDNEIVDVFVRVSLSGTAPGAGPGQIRLEITKTVSSLLTVMDSVSYTTPTGVNWSYSIELARSSIIDNGEVATFGMRLVSTATTGSAFSHDFANRRLTVARRKR